MVTEPNFWGKTDQKFYGKL